MAGNVSRMFATQEGVPLEFIVKDKDGNAVNVAGLGGDVALAYVMLKVGTAAGVKQTVTVVGDGSSGTLRRTTDADDLSAGELVWQGYATVGGVDYYTADQIDTVYAVLV